jgi:hypothetical protein
LTSTASENFLSLRVCTRLFLLVHQLNELSDRSFVTAFRHQAPKPLLSSMQTQPPCLKADALEEVVGQYPVLLPPRLMGFCLEDLNMS